MTTITTELVPTANLAGVEELIQVALATCPSPKTRRVYALWLRGFLLSGRPLSREGVALHLQDRREAGAQGGTLNGTVSAIRKLALEAQLRGLLSFEELANIRSIKGGKQFRTKLGQWLTVAQVQTLLDLPDRSTYYGKRDAALLSVFVGCALRREEVAILPWEKYQPREGRMCLVDLLGKGNKHRTVPVPLWAQADLDAWQIASRTPPSPSDYTGIYRAIETRRVTNLDLITGGLTYDGLAKLVEGYGNRMGVCLAPHDLRRTLAQMLRRNGAPLEQIQQTLGHARLETTQTYLGSSLEMAPGLAAVDMIPISRRGNPNQHRPRVRRGEGQPSEAAGASSSGCVNQSLTEDAE